MRKVFLEDLPKDNGKGKTIDWKKSKGYNVKFQYSNIQGTIEIIDYKSDEQNLFIKHKEKIFKIAIGNFAKCKLGNLLGEKSNSFKIEIGINLKTDSHDLMIIDREYRERYRKNGYIESQKWYKYKCNKCGYEEWIEESKLTRGDGCSACRITPRIVVLGINTIWDTDSWMCDLGVSEEDAKKYTKGSGEYITVKCPDCSREKRIRIADIYHYHTIRCVCGDGISYPEKIMYNVLEQLNLNIITQLSKTTFKWCDNYRYDFYIPSVNSIIETHGKQHYEEAKGKFKISLFESQENDKLKEQLARENDINKYIIIDCRKSELEWIKNSILNSILNNLFDLSKIDWLKGEEFALSNLVKVACDYKRNYPNMTTVDIEKIMNIHSKTINDYLKKGTKLGWCNYNPKEEMKKIASENGKKQKGKKIASLSKKVEILKNDISLGIFESYSELQNKSEKIFGIKLYYHRFSKVVNKNKTYNGYYFKSVV